MSKELFTRYTNNPILSGTDLPYQANTVFNAAAARLDGETLLLLRVEDRRGLSHLTVARSKDGVSDWRVDPAPTLLSSPETHPEELWGIEDPRVTYLEEERSWGITYTGYGEAGPLVCLATTRDFQTFNRLGAILPPENKDAALFPVRFDGRWALLHRPVAGFHTSGAHIWLSFSPDLKHWGDHQISIKARSGGYWDAGKIGLSPQPLRTERGWLVLYHGVRNTASGAIYRLGLALLDLKNPRHVLQRGDEWIFTPSETYERLGDVGNVTFPCGWLQSGDEVRIYYGAADTCIGLATARIDELLTWLEDHHVR